MELSNITNPLKLLLTYGYMGFSNYVHFKNFKTESWDIKDRLKSYNMKYPITKQFNQIFLSEPRILYYLLILNFLLIMSSVLLRKKNLGYFIVIIFILNEFYFYNDLIMRNIYDFNTIKANSVLDLIQKIPIDIGFLISLLFGVLFVTSKNPNKTNVNKNEKTNK